MIAQPLSSLHPENPAPASLRVGVCDSASFGQVLAKAMDAQDKGRIDPADEEEALKELFHILALLSEGLIDGSVLAEKAAGPSNHAGHYRREVETLKAVIRLVMREGVTGDPMEIDPKTGKKKPRGPSLNQLFYSLPADLRNLLLRAFPRLKELLLEEQQRLLGAGMDDADPLTAKGAS